MLFLPSCRLPASLQCRVSGMSFLAYTVLGLSFSIAVIFHHPAHSVIMEVEGRSHASIVVALLCFLSASAGPLLSRLYWLRSRALLATARPVSVRSLSVWSGNLDWAPVILIITIGVGLGAAFAARSITDLVLATLCFANIGTASLRLGRQIRSLEHRRHVSFYCLVDANGSWRMVHIER